MDTYTAEDRAIYKFHDGSQPVFGDPLRINRVLYQHLDGDPNRFLEDSRSAEPGLYYPAIEKLLTAVRAAFDLQPFDRGTGQGATDRHCLRVLDDFLRWLDAQKKSGGLTPTSPPSSASASSAPAVPPTPPSSDCGCT